MSQVLERSVLFADLRGSTSMFEALGNTDATTVVTRSVAMLGRVVSLHGGVVVKTLGDGLMAVFQTPSSGVAAADDMHDSLARVTDAGSVDEMAALLSHAITLKLQVALAHGEVVEMSGDVFGDAVNVAARLLDHAGDNETLATASVVAGLDDWERSRFRSLDHMQLRGRAEPVHVHLQEASRRFGDTQSTAYGDMLPPPRSEPEAIRLIWQALHRVFGGASLPLILGRSAQATYIIDDDRVSRSHARIDWHGGTFQLTDLSYNGTYVRFDNDPEILSLRRGACTLHGAGMIGLGTPPADDTSPTVRFEVLRYVNQRSEIPEFGPKP